MLDGHKDLGKEIKGLEGLTIPPCKRGGKIEELTKTASALFQDFKTLCDKIIKIKKEELDLVNIIGWYDSKENSKGVVKKLVENGRKLEELANDQQTKILVADIRNQEKNILQRGDKRYIDRLKKSYGEFAASTKGDINSIGKAYYEDFETIFDKVVSLSNLRNELKQIIRKDLREKQKSLDEAVNALKQRAQEQMVAYSYEATSMEKSARTFIIIISLSVVFLSLAFGWCVSNGINKALTKIIENLSDGSDQVASASSQVSSASQSLAEGASEQAASLEETSSSLEEMASMTRQNADNASQADGLMKEANQVVVQAGESMIELTTSMEDISKASEETSKIIKTIDEIAFQTNLLALNAAVEAARAGEAGAGFAVVADEVRNLAMRAADAAKDTANLIEGTVHKIKNGSELVDKTNQAFTQVSESSSKVGELVGEIAAASTEQAQGIDQINKAVNEMDKVTQQNAANAEESASASEEMNAQADSMKGVVEELVALVGGRGNDYAHKQLSHADSGGGKMADNKGIVKAHEITPEQVIPMDQEEFKDF